MKKLIVTILSVNELTSRAKLLKAVQKYYDCSERKLRKVICKMISEGIPVASSLKGYSIIKTWKDWEASDKFLTSYIRKLQSRRTRLKKNVQNYLLKPKLI